MTFVAGEGWKLDVADGWVLVSEGALQYQKRNTGGKLGVTHSVTGVPTIGASDDFIEVGVGLRMSFGNSPCYIHAINESVYLAYLDIS